MQKQKLDFTKRFIFQHLIPVVYTQVILFLNWPYNAGSDKVKVHHSEHILLSPSINGVHDSVQLIHGTLMKSNNSDMTTGMLLYGVIYCSGILHFCWSIISHLEVKYLESFNEKNTSSHGLLRKA